MYPEDLRYSSEHEWVKVEGNKARIGVTHYAQSELGDVVFVDLPSVGDTLVAGQAFAVIESVKSVSDVYAPVSGTVVAVNDRLSDSPELINQSPYEDGWIVEVELSDPSELDNLMTADEYRASVAGEEADGGED
ncbi:MAG: glycine cleavage system protein GcvH [Limnochordales bacterium]|nr:glycine cleavage system protein GcvH [Limnochordales bacterium]